MAVFMLGSEDDEKTVDNVDAELIMNDRTRWSATVMTLSAIERVLNTWRGSGEYSSGSFFQCPDLVVVPRAGIEAMIEAFDAVVEAGGPAGIVQFLPPGAESEG